MRYQLSELPENTYPQVDLVVIPCNKFVLAETVHFDAKN